MPPKHFPALDGLRGVAILTVFLLHYGGGAQASNPLLRAAGELIKAGWSGVTLFFVLSGFLISGILWDARHTEGWWRNFYMRRTLRIFPLYYGALLLVLLTAVLSGHTRTCLSHLWVYLLYLQNSIIVTETGSPLGLSHFWSLAVEEQFYLLWPFLLFAANTLEQAKRICAGVFLLSMLFRAVTWWVYGYDAMNQAGCLVAQCGNLAVGAYLAMCFRQPAVWAKLQARSTYIGMTSLLVFLTIGIVKRQFGLDTALMYILGVTAISVFFGALLVRSMGDGKTNWVMRMPWLQRIGKISYGLYVFHVLFKPLVLWMTLRGVPHASMHTRLVMNFFIAAVLSYILAALSFRYFETPFLNRRSRYRSDESLSDTTNAESLTAV